MELAFSAYKKKSHIHILTQNNGRGIPEEVIYKEEDIIKAQSAVWGTFKEVHIDSGGEINNPLIIDVYVYDTKPDHTHKTEAEHIDWVMKEINFWR